MIPTLSSIHSLCAHEFLVLDMSMGGAVRYEQLEKLLIRAVADDQFADELRFAGTSARMQYLLDDEEVELLSILLRDDGVALEAILRVARAASATAALRTIESAQQRV